MDDSDLIEQNSDYLVTETTIRTSVDADKIIGLLKARGTTGELCFDFRNGGIRKIRLSEHTRASGSKSDEIRKILGMN